MHAPVCDESAKPAHWTFEDRAPGLEVVRVWTYWVNGQPMAYVSQGRARWGAYIEGTCSDVWPRDWATLENAQEAVERIVERLLEAA